MTPARPYKNIRVLHAPGHMPGHTIFQFQDIVFTGDLFKYIGGHFPTFPEFMNWDQAQAKESLSSLKHLEFEWLCPSHVSPVHNGPELQEFLTKYDFLHYFDIDRIRIDHGTTVGDYSYTFKGLGPDIMFDVSIVAREPDWSERAGFVPVKTPLPTGPEINLSLGWYTANSVRLKGEIINTGTGPGPYSCLAEEIKTNALTILPRSADPAGNLTVGDPAAVFSLEKPWDEWDNFFDRYRPYIELSPDTEYVAQVKITNIYDDVAYSDKIYFKTFAFPTITYDTVTPRSYDAYVYVNIALDTGDSLSSLGLYADDDAQQPKDDSAHLSAELVRFDDDTGTAVFHLTGLTPEMNYELQAYTKSGAGEKWSDTRLMTTLSAPVLASVHTQSVTALRSNRAMMHANISSMGNSYVLEQGFAYSTDDTDPRPGDPGVTVVKVPITSQTDGAVFSGLADNLAPGTNYYYQAYVRNNVGTSVGGVGIFTTLPAPAVTTGSAGNITPSSANIYGTVSSTGGISPTLRGIVYAQDPATPVLGGEGTMFSLSDVVDTSTGAFDVDVTGLSPDTKYNYRTFIHSEAGMVYGDTLDFTTDDVATLLPLVTTYPILTSSITETTAPVIGSFTAPDGIPVTETGFVYSLSPHPVLWDDDTMFVPLTDTDSSFGTTLTGLASDTTSSVRAPAPTPACPPLVARGFVSGTTANPALGGAGVAEAAADSGTGNFSAPISSLSAGTTYHVRAWSLFSNQVTLYGEDRTFTTRQETGTGGSAPPEEPEKKDEVPPAGEIGFLDMPETDNPWGNVILHTDPTGAQFIVGLGIVEGSRMKYISRGPTKYEIIYNAKPLDDIAGHWAEHDIDFNSARLLFNGVTPNLFKPDARTRGQKRAYDSNHSDQIQLCGVSKLTARPKKALVTAIKTRFSAYHLPASGFDAVISGFCCIKSA